MAFNPNDHLMSLKGKEYLQVMWRLVWFRDEKPLWCIDTQLEQLTDKHAVFSAKIFDENGVLKAAGYGSESINDFRDYIEKAETKAVGRALAMLGYGTQFAPEMDECEDGKDRIVDSPVAKASPKKEPVKAQEYGNVAIFRCACCDREIEPYKNAAGRVVTVDKHCKASKERFGRQLCLTCIEALKNQEKEGIE
ncbi:hypothetical protein [Anaerotignum sp.]